MITQQELNAMRDALAKRGFVRQDTGDYCQEWVRGRLDCEDFFLVSHSVTDDAPLQWSYEPLMSDTSRREHVGEGLDELLAFLATLDSPVTPE